MTIDCISIVSNDRRVPLLPQLRLPKLVLCKMSAVDGDPVRLCLLCILVSYLVGSRRRTIAKIRERLRAFSRFAKHRAKARLSQPFCRICGTSRFPSGNANPGLSPWKARQECTNPYSAISKTAPRRIRISI